MGERVAHWAVVVKRLAAVVLLIALFLPLSQCSKHEWDPQTKASKITVTVKYAYAVSEPVVDAAAAYGAFLWPALFACAFLLWPSLNHMWTVAMLEVVLCLASAYELVHLVYYHDLLLYGTYVTAGAIGAYLIAVLLQIAFRIRKKWVMRRVANA
jgi:hypothetical protein